jgi:carboxymethylenebutenolidase
LYLVRFIKVGNLFYIACSVLFIVDTIILKSNLFSITFVVNQHVTLSLPATRIPSPHLMFFKSISYSIISSPAHSYPLPVTGPVARFARQIASQGYIVAAPSSYHEFTGPEPLAYDVPGTDAGNEWKITKTVAAYDEDATLAIDTLLALPTCNGRVGATGMCLGGHLAYRCALDTRISAAVCYFATDIHSATLGAGKSDDSLQRAGDIKGELVMIFGKADTHVPAEGRDLIRKTLHEKGVRFSWYEIMGAQHAFIRDELSKGRYDAAVTGVCWEMLREIFGRTLRSDLGPREGGEVEVEDVC